MCSEVTGWSLYLSPKGFSASPGFAMDIYYNRVLPSILLLSSVYLWNILGGNPTLFWFLLYLYPSDLVLNLPANSFPTFSCMVSLSSPSPQAAKSLLSSISKGHCLFSETLSDQWRLIPVSHLCSPKTRCAQKSHLFPMMKTLSSAVHREYIA